MKNTILKAFFDYYAFLIKEKEVLSSSKIDPASTQDDSDQQEILDSDLTRTQNDLAAQINEFCLIIKDQNTYISKKMLDNIKFNICAFTDEMMIFGLADNDYSWQKYLAEIKIFGTTVGGERFFEVLDFLLSNYEKNYRDIAILYTLMLRLGFKGRYRDREDQNPLQSYLTSLLEFTSNKKDFTQQKYLFPENYQTIHRGKPSLLFPSYQRFFINICLFLLFYFLIYGLIWFFTIDDISSLITNIQQDNLLNF